MVYRLGIDVGSTTAKIVVLDQNDDMVFSDYRRHNAETVTTLQSIIDEALLKLGDIFVSFNITGSAGLGVSEKYNFPFIQEVIASAEFVNLKYPQVNTLIDVGGEDAKMIFFNPGGVPDIRMNGNCAGGTGAFIDEMASLLDVPVSELNSLAEEHTHIYPMASRCGVFAKTDLQNLLSRQISRPDIAASVFHAVVLQTLATLARGYTPKPIILFSGGPLTFFPALRASFMKVLDLDAESALEIDNSELLPAIGAAVAVNVKGGNWSLNQINQILRNEPRNDHGANTRLPPLFENNIDFTNWEQSRLQNRIGRIDMQEASGVHCFLGVDSGSTTSKMALIDSKGRIIFQHYCNNKGNALKAVQEGMDLIQAEFAKLNTPPRILRSVATGYGEDLIQAAFGFDDGIVETLAHYRAARAFDPNVSFVLDIGGQDMKAIFIRDGNIQNIEINEACSSGCGSFIQSFSGSLGYPITDFAQKACSSDAPCDLGTRCTVFMNSKVKQALREGAQVSDISAGLAYSVIKNAIHKVLKITNPDILGDHIVVQGGTFKNPAIHRAIEQLLGKQVTCPDIAELMGAYGAALTARDSHKRNGHPRSKFLDLDNLNIVNEYSTRQIRCRGCENQCDVTKLIFQNGNTFFTGNRCEKIYTNRGKRTRKGENLIAIKHKLLFDREQTPESKPLLTIGIPRALNFYENFPFWNTLFVECGIQVKLSDPSSNAIYEKGAGTVMSENICFPAKLVHGHIFNLIESGVDRIFFPMVYYERCEFSDSANCFNCPIVSGYADVIRSSIDPGGNYGIPLDQPTITFNDLGLLRKACFEYLRKLGVRKRTFNSAFNHALAEQQVYKDEVSRRGRQILTQARAENRPVALLMSHPYHLDPKINHKIPDILSDFGMDIITEDSVLQNGENTLDNQHMLSQWEYINRFFYAARWAGNQPDVEVVQLNSFACGPDAYSLDEVKQILGQFGKGYTVIRIDEIESTGSAKLRIRSMIEALKYKEKPKNSIYIPRKAVKLYEAEDRQKTILTPHFSHFCAPTVSGPLLNMGYPIETLPPPDRESVETGLRYTNNEICFPGIVVIGDIIKALESGEYDLDNVAVGSWVTGGQCRASSILSLLRKALIASGHDDIPIVALTTDKKLHEQPGMNLNYKDYVSRAMVGAAYSDSISSMYNATAVREVEKGTALYLADKHLAPLNDGSLQLDKTSILERLEQVVFDFNHIETADQELPKVGIVGEIYVKYNSFVNNNVTNWLIQQGIEVVTPPFLEFFLGWLISSGVQIQAKLKRRNLLWILATLLDGYIHSFLNDVSAIMKDFRYFPPNHTIHDIAHKAREIVTLTHQYGEGWLIAGEVGEFMKAGINNVLCLQPFGCIANQVIAKGVEKRMRDIYPQLNMLFLDLDAGVSEVNYFNRLYFFINHAKTANMKYRALKNVL